MNNMKGAARLRRAIENQDSLGAQDFSLDMGAAYELLHEVEQEAGRGRDAIRELTALKIDLGWTDETPEHYIGDGKVSCQRALLSMSMGWAAADTVPPFISMFWATTAFKYIWRLPFKEGPRENLRKAIDCLRKALDTFERSWR